MKTAKTGTSICIFLMLCFSFGSMAQYRKSIETSTDILAFVNPVAGFVGSMAIRDFQGSKQIVLGGITNLATNYLLEYSIRKKRPDGSGHHAFPSTHTAVSFQGAAFLQRRYGWKFGAPAYLLSAYVGWGRIYAKKHDIWDVLAGAAIGAGSAYIYTRPFAKKQELTLSPTVMGTGYPGLYASLRF